MRTSSAATIPSAPPRPRSRPVAGLVARLEELGRTLRPTPLLPLAMTGVQLFAKLEYLNPVGSIKDRPAFWILKRAVERGEIGENTTIVESSSGNFASALATYARLLGLSFIPVIDPNISGQYESFLRRLCPRVEKVTERDDTGGFLKTRLARVEHLRQTLADVYWTNQYGNPDAADAHYHLTAGEICRDLPSLDYAFIGVSTGGTIAGVSRRLKEQYPGVRVVAVDTQGSVIFGDTPRKRHIPGLGSSIAPPLVAQALIDDVVLVPERDAATACRELLATHGVFAGGSSGSAYAATQRYGPIMRRRSSGAPPVALFLCADRGTAYLDTVFDPAWSTRLE